MFTGTILSDQFVTLKCFVHTNYITLCTLHLSISIIPLPQILWAGNEYFQKPFLSSLSVGMVTKRKMHCKGDCCKVLL